MNLNFILMDETERTERMIKQGKRMIKSGEALIECIEEIEDMIPEQMKEEIWRGGDVYKITLPPYRENNPTKIIPFKPKVTNPAKFVSIEHLKNREEWRKYYNLY